MVAINVIAKYSRGIWPEPKGTISPFFLVPSYLGKTLLIPFSLNVIMF